jgi:ring-1,2-phenylacetyl-CoA epoxidase subunit PaaD
MNKILHILETVKDPEIPVLSLVDLGVITDVVVDGDTVLVKMTPTFVGCPAMDYMKAEVETALQQHGYKPHVTISFEKPWSSDLISEKGKAALKKYGLAPPPDNKLFTDLEIRNRHMPPLQRHQHRIKISLWPYPMPFRNRTATAPTPN